MTPAVSPSRSAEHVTPVSSDNSSDFAGSVEGDVTATLTQEVATMVQQMAEGTWWSAHSVMLSTAVVVLLDHAFNNFWIVAARHTVTSPFVVVAICFRLGLLNASESLHLASVDMDPLTCLG